MGNYQKPKHQQNWNDEDVRKLMKLAGTMTKEDIAKELNTTVNRVVNKSAAQGIKLKVIKND